MRSRLPRRISGSLIRSVPQTHEIGTAALSDVFCPSATGWPIPSRFHLGNLPDVSLGADIRRSLSRARTLTGGPLRDCSEACSAVFWLDAPRTGGLPRSRVYIPRGLRI